MLLLLLLLLEVLVMIGTAIEHPDVAALAPKLIEALMFDAHVA